MAPVGRLDKASEGLLLLSNDPEWAARITDPDQAVLKALPRADRPSTRRGQLARCASASSTAKNTWSAVGWNCCAAAAEPPGWPSLWTKAAIARSGACCRRRGIGAATDRVGIGGLVGDLAKGKLRELKATDLARLSPQAAAHAIIPPRAASGALCKAELPAALMLV